MKTYFNNLNEREKWMVIIGVACLMLYFYYSFLYTPLNMNVTQKSTQLLEKTSTLQWMNTVRQHSRQIKTKEKVDDSQLLSIVATQLKETPASKKFPYQLQQTGSGEIQLTFDTVAFNPFIEWLKKFQDHYAISIKQFNAESSATPGLVRMMIIMSAAT